ncbi:SGNH/GDSL hydrolase family protein [Marinoscillum furvescens]|uniref:Lysophospholipase L1-like esterase n=1 Tax=Marinoscillum furvescens DSM 4134 TaxID=1122208 RepID=A0A3D9L026_MARFU|nr:SGNH/GDSL hydrolase family protein [Marinoscillum furvescens]RED96250.1 lysophospholipase L1-like esterase [Marinoscillum furvescens DSM 4134]
MKLVFLFFLIIPLACMEADEPMPDTGGMMPEGDEPQDTTNTDNTMDALTYLALGDSYTIGESVKESERWPVQLVSRLNNETKLEVADPQIIATTGWTTSDLQGGIAREKPKGPFDLVSLLIGVNNQYRGYPFAEYEKEFPELLEAAIAYAGGDVSRVFVVSIPDYGVTPFAENSDSDKIAKELDAYNAFARAQAEAKGVMFFNITDISREATDKPEYVAGDGLHPSGVMYTEWVRRIFPWVAQTLNK